MFAAPTGGQVSAGQASIQQQGTTTNIHQSSQNAAINWQQFNIQSHETVNFHQPNRDAITLNRVLGNERSLIEGAMNANGNVFISNPNGVLIGNGASINVGGLVATTHKISDADLMQGKLQFSGNNNGKVENLGNIKVPKGGVVALVAPVVKNSGQITASEGAVLLASAEAFRLSLPNDNFSYTLTRGTLQGLVDNGGAILADGGRVVLTAKGVSEVKKSVVKHSGTIQANTVRKTNGVVELLGDLDNSELHFSGSITAEAPNGGDGGFVETSAVKVKIADSAKVSTKAKSGKMGNWVIDPKDFTVAASGGDITGRKVTESLKTSNVELKSRDGAKEGKGDVIVNDEISWNANTLTLNADNDIHINKTLNGSGTAKLAFKFGQETSDGGKADYHLAKGVKVNLPEGDTLVVQKGHNGDRMNFKVVHSMPDDDIRSFKHRFVAIGRDIDLSRYHSLPHFAGWSLMTEQDLPPGTNIDEFAKTYYEKFYGLGHSLTNFRININSNTYNELKPMDNDSPSGILRLREVGLLRSTFKSEIRDVHLPNVDISARGFDQVGGLIGDAASAVIKNSFVSGRVSGRSLVGGLVGSLVVDNEEDILAASIIDSETSVEVSGSGSRVAGLVGEADAKRARRDDGQQSSVNIIRSSASGTVEGERAVGGLVGAAGDVNIIRSFAENNVSGNEDVGGLIGSAYHSKIIQSYGDSAQSIHARTNEAGGLIGTSLGSEITDSYAAGNVSGGGWLGGLIGSLGHTHNNSQEFHTSIRNSFAVGNVQDVQNNNNGLVGGDVGRLYGTRNKLTVISSYFDRDNTDTSTFEDKGKAVPNAALKQRSTFQGWDFDKVWRINEGVDFPRLRALTENLTIDLGTLVLKAKDLTKEYNGQPIIAIDELEALREHTNGIIAKGLKNGDRLDDPKIFSGKLQFGGSWNRAVNVGEYSIEPYGLSSQKYNIQFQNGKLTITPRMIGIQGTRPYNGSYEVRVDEGIRLTNVLEDDLRSVRITGSAEMVREQNNQLTRISDVGTHRLHAGNLTSSNPNYRVDLAISHWTITPKVIHLKGTATQGEKRVTAANVNIANLGIERADLGNVRLTGQGTLNAANKVASGNSFALTGTKANNYKLLTTTTAWTINAKPEPTPTEPKPKPTEPKQPEVQPAQPETPPKPTPVPPKVDQELVNKIQAAKDALKIAQRAADIGRINLQNFLKQGKTPKYAEWNALIDQRRREAREKINQLPRAERQPLLDQLALVKNLEVVKVEEPKPSKPVPAPAPVVPKEEKEVAHKPSEVEKEIAAVSRKETNVIKTVTNVLSEGKKVVDNTIIRGTEFLGKKVKEIGEKISETEEFNELKSKFEQQEKANLDAIKIEDGIYRDRLDKIDSYFNEAKEKSENTFSTLAKFATGNVPEEYFKFVMGGLSKVVNSNNKKISNKIIEDIKAGDIPFSMLPFGLKDGYSEVDLNNPINEGIINAYKLVKEDIYLFNDLSSLADTTAINLYDKALEVESIASLSSIAVASHFETNKSYAKRDALSNIDGFISSVTKNINPANYVYSPLKNKVSSLFQEKSLDIESLSKEMNATISTFKNTLEKRDLNVEDLSAELLKGISNNLPSSVKKQFNNGIKKSLRNVKDVELASKNISEFIVEWSNGVNDYMKEANLKRVKAFLGDKKVSKIDKLKYITQSIILSSDKINLAESNKEIFVIKQDSDKRYFLERQYIKIK